MENEIKPTDQNRTPEPPVDRATIPDNQKSGLSTQHSLPIAEIRDGIVILKDGSFRAIVRALAVNFELMNAEEQEGVEYAYQSFLNSLYFPVQIHIQSRSIDAEAYLKKVENGLKQQNNMLLTLLTSDYLDFLAELLTTTDIVDKNFYVIVSYYPSDFSKDTALNTSKNLLSKLWYIKKNPAPLVINDKVFQNAKKELRYRLQTVQEGLRQCGVLTEPLNTKELIDLFYKFYNPQAGLNQPLADEEDITSPIITKKKGDNNQQVLETNHEAR